MDAHNTKICPYCSEEIKATAIKCKHCFTMLDESNQAIEINAAPIRERSKNASGSVWNKWWAWVCVITVIVFTVAGINFLTPSYYEGEWTSPDGHNYVGEFKNGNFHGYGTLIFPEGHKYVGEFKDGKFHGQGYFSIMNPNMGGHYWSWYDGEWENGEPVQSCSESIASASRLKIFIGENYLSEQFQIIQGHLHNVQ